MAKKRSKPNIPEEVLERARKQAAGEQEDNLETKNASAERARRRAERRAAREKTNITSTRASSSTGRTLADRLERQSKTSGNEMIENMLANPTKVVTEAEFRQEYGHVIVDIRNMFALAGVLMVALVIIAQFI
ncbi:MAG: hypothetical protein Kow00117_16990 [Phototrophicales bacterium]